MSANWVEKSSVKEVIEEVKAKFEKYHTYHAILMNMDIFVLEISSLLSYSDSISESDFYFILSETLFECYQNHKFNSNSILEGINDKIIRYFKTPESDYVIRTSLSINVRENIRPVYFDDVKISFSKKNDQAFAENAKEIVDQFKNRYGNIYPIKYHPIRIYVRHKSPLGALFKASDTLDFFRGLLNFHLTKYKRIVVNDIYDLPINRIVTGPVHTIHFANGKLVEKSNYSYSPDYSGCIDSFINVSDLELSDAFAKLRKWIPIVLQHRYKDEIIEIFKRYARALDSRNYDVSFLLLSSLLEKLTGIKHSYVNDLPVRVSYFYKNSQYHKFTLEKLRKYRDSNVHGGYTSIMYGEAYAYMLKQYVDTLLEFHLFNENKFNNLDEAVELFNTPKDLQKILLKKKYLDITSKKFLALVTED